MYYLQKKIVFESNTGARFEKVSAVNEDQIELLADPAVDTFTGKLKIYDTDGTTLIFDSTETLLRGMTYKLVLVP